VLAQDRDKTEIVKFDLMEDEGGTDASGNRSLGADYLHLEMHQTCFNDFAIKKMQRYIPVDAVRDIKWKETPYAEIR